MEQTKSMSNKFEQETQFWREKLRGEVILSHFPVDTASREAGSISRQTYTLAFPPAITERLLKISNHSDFLLNIILLSGLKFLLYRFTGSSDILIGAPVFKQNTHTASLLNYMLLLKTELSEEDTFKQLLSKVRLTVAEANEHQNIPFAQLLTLADLPLNEHNLPLFHTVMMLQGIHDRAYLQHIDTTMLFVFTKASKTLELQIEYKTSLYQASTVERLATHLLRYFQVVVEQPDRRLAEIDLLSEQERQQLLEAFNDTTVDYPLDKTIHRLFEEQVKRSPDHPAVVYEDQQLTYRELNARSNQLARLLQKQGVGADVPVGIVVGQCVEMVIAIFAVLKAGGAYVPIDPRYPKARIETILRSSGTTVLLIQRQLLNAIDFSGKTFVLDEEALYQGDTANLEETSQAHHLAYIVFTSGTTGNPKGVMIEHRSLVNFSLWEMNYYGITARDRTTKYSGFSFDATICELYPYLITGATVYIVADELRLDLPGLNAYFERNHISASFLPTHICEQFMELDNTSLRVLLTGGDKLKHFKEQRYLVVNNYGPTENTCIATVFPLHHKCYKNIPIGKPIHNNQLYILDVHNHLQPIGAVGEICIGGRQLARGYFNQSELTASKWVANPFVPGEMMYRTGDLGRWLPDGNVEFLGRVDQQVKVRGYRIELAEIESQLLRHELVREAVLVARADQSGEKFLCAYIVPHHDVSESKLKQYLSQSLPHYMIPQLFVMLERIPLTPNGKVDSSALPEPNLHAIDERAYVAPRNEAEALMAKIWQDVLDLEQISIYDNFFSLGGHSLSAIKIISGIQTYFQLEVPFSLLFQAATIADLTQYLQEMARSEGALIATVEARDNYPVTSPQRRMFIVHALEEGTSTNYNIPIIREIRGPLDVRRLRSALNAIVQRQEILRTDFVLQDGILVQRVHGEIQFAIPIIQASEEQADSLVRGFVRPFNLEQAPLFRVSLLRLEPERHILLADIHHIIGDLYSLNVLQQELLALYRGEELPPLRIQYKDYAVWQEQRFQSGAMHNQKAYWMKQLAGEISTLQLPTDNPRPAVPQTEGAQLVVGLDKELVQGLQQLAATLQTTLYTVLLAAYAVLLYKYSRQEEIVIGSPIAGRLYSELEHMVGMFVNILALRCFPQGDKTFYAFLNEIKETVLEAFEHQEYPFDLLVEELDIHRDASHHPLFDVVFGLETNDDQVSQFENLTFAPYHFANDAVKFDLALLALETDRGYELLFRYNSYLFQEDTMKLFTTTMVELLQAVVRQPEILLRELIVPTEEERQRQLVAFNSTLTEIPLHQTICDLFAEQVKRTPDHLAVVQGSSSLTYQELNRRANQLACILQEQGVRAETIVAILTESSFEMFIGIFAVLKAGGAYLPIEPSYPEERIAFMLDDSQAQIVLTTKALAERAGNQRHCIDLQDCSFYQGAADNLISAPRPVDLAYVIYTSGSSGLPKGVMIEHRTLVNLALWNASYLQLGPSDHTIKYASVSFDASVIEIFPAFISGTTIYIVNPELRLHLPQLNAYFEEQAITAAFLPTPVCEQFLELDNSSLRVLFTGGDKLNTYKPTRYQLFNMYGPAENTVAASAYPVTHAMSNIPIGKPIANNQIYIVDDHDNLLPIGVPGELCIGGLSVGRGYWRQPALTAQKFVLNPFVPGEKMYKTGDMARWRSDGNLEFLGRLDSQIKIRGYRIEAGEVEAQLLALGTIRAAVVLAHDRQLCAYVVADQPIQPTELRMALLDRLPDYMVPLYFVQIDAIPLTTNGKVDRNALPVPDRSFQEDAHYVPPRSPIERVLVEIWQQVLHLERVGIHDNFFALGGDSILSIQIIAQAQHMGLHLTPRQLFQYQTIAQLAIVVTEAVATQDEQEDVVGAVPLTPIQHWFFEQNFSQPYHFNQSLLLQIPDGWNQSVLQAACEAVFKHHDALRLRYQYTVEGWQQRVVSASEAGPVPFTFFDLTTIPPEEQKIIIEVEADRMQASLSLEEGPLLRVALFRTGPRQPARLFIVVHHLAIDGVSWRILLEDMQLALSQLLRGEAVHLPPKTASIQRWSQHLQQLAFSPLLEQEKTYWLAAAQTPTPPLPLDFPDGRNTMDSMRSISRDLTSEKTRQILQGVPACYHIRTQELLLVALLQTLARWAMHSSMRITLEGHGREDLATEALDVSRTVGWFTSLYPVLFHLPQNADPGDWIKTIKEQLRSVPHHGVGYGLLRYFSADQSIKAQLQAASPSQVSFNYLGQFDQVVDAAQGSGDSLRLADESAGSISGARNMRSHCLDFLALVVGGQLQIQWSYSEQIHRRETVEALAQTYEEALDGLIAYCLSSAEAGYTPTDFPLARLAQEELDDLLKHYQVADVYPLTSLQKEMLFQTLDQPHSGRYLIQFSCTALGQLNLQVFERAWQQVIEHHTILRTTFLWRSQERPLQIVCKQAAIPMTIHDWSKLPPDQQQENLRVFLHEDRINDFTLQQAPLMRLHIIRLDETRTRIIWSFHHLLLDGWSVSMVVQELFASYEALLRGQVLELEQRRPYRDYIDWLQQQDLCQAEIYWRRLLAGFPEPTPLPVVYRQQSNGVAQPDLLCESASIQLADDVTQHLEQVARRYEVTLNTLFQAAWSIVLARHSGQQDVLFGAVVSGRSPALRGVERMVGMLIHVLPVRVHINGQETLESWLKRLQEQQAEQRQYDHTPSQYIQQWSEIPQGQQLFESVLIFENYPTEKALSKRPHQVIVEDVESTEMWPYALTLFILPATKTSLLMMYRPALFEALEIEHLLLEVQDVLKQFEMVSDQSLGEFYYKR